LCQPDAPHGGISEAPAGIAEAIPAVASKTVPATPKFKLNVLKPLRIDAAMEPSCSRLVFIIIIIIIRGAAQLLAIRSSR
jgi:hypothetical protein